MRLDSFALCYQRGAVGLAGGKCRRRALSLSLSLSFPRRWHSEPGLVEAPRRFGACRCAPPKRNVVTVSALRLGPSISAMAHDAGQNQSVVTCCDCCTASPPRSRCPTVPDGAPRLPVRGCFWRQPLGNEAFAVQGKAGGCRSVPRAAGCRRRRQVDLDGIDTTSLCKPSCPSLEPRAPWSVDLPCSVCCT